MTDMVRPVEMNDAERQELAERLRHEVIPREMAKRKAEQATSEQLAHLVEDGYNLTPIVTKIEMDAYIHETKARFTKWGLVS